MSYDNSIKPFISNLVVAIYDKNEQITKKNQAHQTNFQDAIGLVVTKKNVYP